VFVSLLYGMTGGRHRYKVHRLTLKFDDLPEAFDGFTITQLSDIHAGSFTSKKGVEKGISLVNKQNSDLILFTGDLVNNMISEMEPWIASFAGNNSKAYCRVAHSMILQKTLTNKIFEKRGYQGFAV